MEVPAVDIDVPTFFAAGSVINNSTGAAAPSASAEVVECSDLERRDTAAQQERFSAKCKVACPVLAGHTLHHLPSRSTAQC